MSDKIGIKFEEVNLGDDKSTYRVIIGDDDSYQVKSVELVRTTPGNEPRAAARVVLGGVKTAGDVEFFIFNLKGVLYIQAGEMA